MNTYEIHSINGENSDFPVVSFLEAAIVLVTSYLDKEKNKVFILRVVLSFNFSSLFQFDTSPLFLLSQKYSLFLLSYVSCPRIPAELFLFLFLGYFMRQQIEWRRFV